MEKQIKKLVQAPSSHIGVVKHLLGDDFEKYRCYIEKLFEKKYKNVK